MLAGSGVAAIAALVYAKRFPGKVDYIGLGTPRVGDEAFKKVFDATVGIRARLKHGRDLVNKVPLALRYTHVGDELCYGRTDWYPSVPLLTDLPDHMQDQYCKAFDEPDPEPALTVGVLGRALDALHKTLMVLIPTHTAQKL